jgi:hypothetical protein
LGANLALAKNFIYSGQDCNIIYNYTPQTGTLSDLRVIYNGYFSFLPSSGGGITIFYLAGERLLAKDGKHVSQMLEETDTGGVYLAKFRWSYNSDSFIFSVSIKLTDKTLSIEYATDASSQNVRKFSLERSEETPDPKVVEVPYGHNVLYTNGIFISAILDPFLSNASGIYPSNELHSTTSASFGNWVDYYILTDRKRNNLRETVHLTVSPDIADTFYQGPNLYSPYRYSLANRVVVDLWRESFQDYRDDLRALAFLGMKDLFVILHMWQKYGFDNGFPSTFPAGSQFGSDVDLLEISYFCKRRDYLFALHTNYASYYQNSDVWNPDDVALDPNGNWLKDWYNPVTGIQSYLLKPSRAHHYAQMYEPSIHRYYGTTAAFLDVLTAGLPSHRVDYDARVSQAGKQAITFQNYLGVISYARNIHDGPVAGEGFGYSTYIWAGSVDAIEADPRSYSDVLTTQGGATVPTIVDYKLEVVNRHFVPHGAGYLERFYDDKWNGYTVEELERYRATELAFGSAGFIHNPFIKGIPLKETAREYFFLSYLQPYYLASEPEEILYNIDGGLIPLSEVLRKVLPGVPFDRVKETLLEELSLVKTKYKNGFTLYVNRSSVKSWDVVEVGRTFTLPPSGFLALMGRRVLAFTAIVGGEKRDYLAPLH